MYDYDVIYNGIVIGNITADNDKEALKLAKKLYAKGKHGQVTVERS